MSFGMGEDGYGYGGSTDHQTTEDYWDSETTSAAWDDSATTNYWDNTATQIIATHTKPSEVTTTTQQWTPVLSTTGSQTTTSQTATQASTTSSSTSSASSNSSGSGNNTKTIAIAVPVAVVGAAIIAGLLFFIMRRRRQRSRNSPPPNPQVDMGVVPRQAVPRSGNTWEFAPASSHDIPFSGPIPGRPVTQPGHSANSSRDLDATSSSQNLTAAAQSTPREPAMNDYEEHRKTTAATRTSMPVISPSIPVWQDQRHSRPISPFDHPLDDAISEVSHISGQRSVAHHRDLDDISSVSSFEDDERRPAIHP
ncbi:hypothetical protein BO71DRAFT_402584 [Aspergillus ellipticus CBS 707.79]|uniref:Mid2 domain-containing protein n=1 Tax=Aspergillus ellipticus CBS 707.79 TaxID=1448320 RepID=A0A319CXS2_9EURO|nr:hypothetical protein BO71DRAFT_402584 [Aspergillus ellipticus CBS 707.79]